MSAVPTVADFFHNGKPFQASNDADRDYEVDIDLAAVSRSKKRRASQQDGSRGKRLR